MVRSLRLRSVSFTYMRLGCVTAIVDIDRHLAKPNGKVAFAARSSKTFSGDISRLQQMSSLEADPIATLVSLLSQWPKLLRQATCIEPNLLEYL